MCTIVGKVEPKEAMMVIHASSFVGRIKINIFDLLCCRDALPLGWLAGNGAGNGSMLGRHED